MGNPVRHSNPSTTVVLVAIGFLALLISCGLVFIIIPIRDVSRSQPVEPSAPVLVHGLDELGAGQETITETLMAESDSFVVYEIDSEGTDLKIFLNDTDHRQERIWKFDPRFADRSQAKGPVDKQFKKI